MQKHCKILQYTFNFSSAKILIEQIKEKEIRRLQEKEIIAREGELMKKQIKAMQDEELRNEERKRLENARLAKEIVKIIRKRRRFKKTKV